MRDDIRKGMNSKGSLGLLLAICMMAALVLSGCSLADKGKSEAGQKAAESGIYRIYYLNSEENGLIYKTYKPKSSDFQGILKEVLRQFCQSPDEGVKSALPDTVTIKSSTIGIQEIDVDFDSAYLSLSKVPELLLRSALVETLVQLPGVDKVRFTVESQPLSIGGVETGAMTEDTFIIPDGNAINPYRTMEIPLYFSSPDGSKLVPEKRKIYYSSNINTERIIAEQIIQGPNKDGENSDKLLPVTRDSVIVLGARIKGDTCLIDFSSTVNDLPTADSPVQPETALYAFVNAICDALAPQDVTGVRFTIEGSSDERFRGQVNLDQTFSPDPERIDQSGKENDEAGVLVDADAGQSAEENPAELPQTEDAG